MGVWVMGIFSLTFHREIILLHCRQRICVFPLCKENRKHLTQQRNTKCFVELNSSAKCTADHFFFSPNGYWNEICHGQICQISRVGGIDGLHAQSGGQMASAVCQRPRPSLSSPQDPSNSKLVWQTGGVCACLSVTGEDRDIRLSSPNTVSMIKSSADLTVHCASA